MYMHMVSFRKDQDLEERSNRLLHDGQMWGAAAAKLVHSGCSSTLTSPLGVLLLDQQRVG